MRLYDHVTAIVVGHMTTHLVDGVVEHGAAPQTGVLAVDDAVERGEALLGGVGRLQVVLLALLSAAPHLQLVVPCPHVVRACKPSALSLSADCT